MSPMLKELPKKSICNGCANAYYEEMMQSYVCTFAVKKFPNRYTTCKGHSDPLFQGENMYNPKIPVNAKVITPPKPPAQEYYEAVDDKGNVLYTAFLSNKI